MRVCQAGFHERHQVQHPRDRVGLTHHPRFEERAHDLVAQRHRIVEELRGHSRRVVQRAEDIAGLEAL